MDRDSSKTLTQNYRRLGLTSRLNSVTGGTEGKISKSHTSSKLAITTAIPTVLAPKEARVERDPETGKITRVIHADAHKKSNNPLNDPLQALDSDNESEFGGFEDVEMEDESGDEVDAEAQRIVHELEEQARMVPEKRVRKQSVREREWIERLVGRYGEDVRAMARDRKLNPMQQTEADIARRVTKWREEGGAVEA
jgi:nucleolar protein 16